MRGIVVLASSVLVCYSVLWAQEDRGDYASMSSPVIRSTEDEVSLSARFSNFVAGNYYRVGAGIASGKISTLKLELSNGETLLGLKQQDFRQGYASDWWGVDQVIVEGFMLGPKDLPQQSEKLVLRVTVSRTEAERAKRIFILVARQYSTDIWYIEDGAEVDDSYW